ncbi:MAG: DUF6597 domain-containing transcriptional factor [Acidimicrobiia bacterium]
MDAWYREWRPPAALSQHVVCTWAGQLGAEGATYTSSVLPDGCIDIVWDGSRLFVAGPDTRAVPIARTPGGSFVGIRFRTGRAPTLLDCRADEIRDQRVELGDVWDAGAATKLSDQLAVAPTLAAAAGALAAGVASALPAAREPDCLADAVVNEYRQHMARAAPAAKRFGVSERTLHRRCVAAIGYGPATLARVLRFRRFIALAERRPDAGLAVLAVDAGYADQAHLTRETRRLASMTPSELVSRPGVRTVQDALAPDPGYS